MLGVLRLTPEVDSQDRIPRRRDGIVRPRRSTGFLLPRTRSQGLGVQLDIASLQNQAHLSEKRGLETIAVVDRCRDRTLISRRTGIPRPEKTASAERRGRGDEPLGMRRRHSRRISPVPDVGSRQKPSFLRIGRTRVAGREADVVKTGNGRIERKVDTTGRDIARDALPRNMQIWTACKREGDSRRT